MEKPMEGKRFGERLKWLNSQVQKLSEAFKRLKNLIYEALKK
jgi:chaperonin cofactor prefoldin